VLVVGDILQPTHLLFVLVVALLVLGPKRLPEVGRSLGRTMRDFRAALSGEQTHEPVITESTPAEPEPQAASEEEAPADEAGPSSEPQKPRVSESAAAERQPTATR
jgi:sec-independent protein translocase protein TatA